VIIGGDFSHNGDRGAFINGDNVQLYGGKFNNNKYGVFFGKFATKQIYEGIEAKGNDAQQIVDNTHRN
jgi:hypothetical protein